MRRVQTVLAWLWLIVLGLAIGVVLWLRLGPAPGGGPAPSRDRVTVYLPEVRGGEVRYTPRSISVRRGTSPYRAAFEHLLAHAVEVPPGTRLLDVRLEGDTLVLDFSEEIRSEFQGGSDAEAALINAIVRTAGTFPEVRQVRVLIEGRPAETIGGHIDVREPLPVERASR